MLRGELGQCQGLRGTYLLVEKPKPKCKDSWHYLFVDDEVVLPFPSITWSECDPCRMTFDNAKRTTLVLS